MTDLTSQWKKGELPSGWYYVRLIRGEYRIDLYINGKNEWIDCPDNIIDTIVCEVPSYDEWKASYNCMLENEVLRLKNAQLKELLKECKQWFDWYHIDIGTGKEYIESWHKKGREIHKQLDEALK